MEPEEIKFSPVEDESVATRAVNNAITRVGRDVAAEVEKEYSNTRNMELESLHDGFIEVIRNQNPSVESVVFVLRQLEHQMLLEHYKKNVDPTLPAAVKIK